MRSRCARGVRHVAAVPAVHAHRCCICAWHACARLSERALAAAVSTTGWCWWDLGLLSGGLGASDGSQMRIAIAHWVGWRFIPIIFREVVGSVRDVGSSARAWGVRNVCAHGGMRVMCVRGRRKISFTPPSGGSRDPVGRWLVSSRRVVGAGCHSCQLPPSGPADSVSDTQRRTDKVKLALFR